jgi:non-haem Fe2+, alpha-ketoglutarate-dependent halogenase
MNKLINQYQENGIFFPVNILDEKNALSYRKLLEDYENNQGEPISGRNNKKIHLLFKWANDLIRKPEILNAVEQVIGPNILCWGSEFFCKEPMTESYVSWHQDATYWGIGNDNIVTVWLALSHSKPSNGCMRVVPKTHKEVVKHEDKGADNNLLSRGQEIAVEVNEEDAIDVTLKPGEASLHHTLIYHGSNPNNSTERRIGFVIRYLSPNIKPQDDTDSATLVRGEDKYNYFSSEPKPIKDFDPDVVAFHKESCENLEKRILN